MYLHIYVLLLVIVSTVKSSTNTANTMMKPQRFSHIRTIAEIFDRYDGFLIDQWGVLHDGKTPYTSVIKTLDEMHNSGKRMVIISNSSKRKESATSGLMRIGINPALFDDIITSGEIGWEYLNRMQINHNAKSKPQAAVRPFRVFVIGSGDEDEEYVSSCQCDLARPEDADLVLVRGTLTTLSSSKALVKYVNAQSLVENVSQILDICTKRSLPMLITNPDFTRPGCMSPMPGMIGRIYQNLSPSSTITYIGKPYSFIYDVCKDISSFRTMDKSRICCVGDSLDHDIVGANRNQYDSVWTMNGVHSNELGTAEGSLQEPNDQLIHNLLGSKKEMMPTYSIAAFR
eukprot:gene6197-8535_t